MELSLQRKVNYKSVRKQRENMIKEENLHIFDSITYEQFLELYQKYANSSISEVEFARYFLDIDWRSWYNLQTQRRDTTSILEREPYNDKEFDVIRQKMVEEEGLNSEKGINYDRLIELHQKYGGKFSLKMFAYEVLSLNAHAVDDMHYNRESERKILREFPQTREQIMKMKANVIGKSRLYMGKKITLEEFLEIHKEFGTDGIDDKDFAYRVLGIQNDFFMRFRRGKSKEATVFQAFPVDAEYIGLVRELVIKSEKLYIEQTLSIEKIEQLHAKYGGYLSIELFVSEVLDINIASFNQSKQRGYNCAILTGIEISDEYVRELQEKIIIENGIKPNNQMMSLKEMNDLRKRYAPMLSEKRFVTLIMGIKRVNYTQLAMGTTKKNIVFPEDIPEDVLTLKQKIIIEEHLHYDDFIDYQRLCQLHQKYAPTMREVYFARYILDISQANLDNLRNKKEKRQTRILLDETLPTSKEIDDLRKKLVGIKEIRNMKSINYKTFLNLYNTYGGIMPEDMFALQVVEIVQKELNLMRCKKSYKTPFLMDAKLEWEKKEKEKKRAVKQEKEEKKNAEKMEAKRIKKEEKEEAKRNKKRDKLLKSLKDTREQKAKRVIEDCDDSLKGIEKVKDYISECEIRFGEGTLQPSQLRLYADSILFIEANCSQIERFAQACMFFEEYDFGSRCISRNLEYNDSLNYEESIKLTQIRDTMRYALRKQKAFNMIARGITDIERICHMTGALEVDVLDIMNRVNAENRMNSFPDGPDDD